MADTEGLLLNLDLAAPSLRSKTLFRGGRWRDRAKAKRGAQRWAHKSAVNVKAFVVNGNGGQHHDQEASVKARKGSHQANEDVQPSSKRRRVDENSQDKVEELQDSLSTGRYAKSHSNQAKPKSRPVVSSLFTYNPVPQTSGEKDVQPSAPALPSNAPLPDGLSTFTDLGLSVTLASHVLDKLHLANPTAIQKTVIPQLIHEDEDAFIQAQTGSGKTLAYLLPIVERLLSASKDAKLQRSSGTFALILAPTRELCRQIAAVLDNLLHCAHWLVSGVIMGGEKKKSEKARLRKGVNVLIATPGRLVDHLDNTKVLDMSNVRFLVFDEGDRLMELGFEEDIRKILSKINGSNLMDMPASITSTSLPRRRMTILCSATLRSDVQTLGEASLKDAVHLRPDPSSLTLNSEPGPINESSTAPSNMHGDNKDNFSAPAQLVQSYAVVPAKLRLVTLFAVLKRAFQRKGSVRKAIVFFSCADSVDFHFSLLTRSADLPSSSFSIASSISPPSNVGSTTSATTTILPGPLLWTPSTTNSTATNPYPQIYRLHASLAPPQRHATLSAFANTPTDTPALLLATDLASRGLDLPSTDLVIEYDPAHSPADHIHRIGRTARAGLPGRALLFLQPGSEENYVKRVLQSGQPSDLAKPANTDIDSTNSTTTHREADTATLARRPLVRHDADSLLRKGFALPRTASAPSSQPQKNKNRSDTNASGSITTEDQHGWRERATDWQLDVERWVCGASDNDTKSPSAPSHTGNKSGGVGKATSSATAGGGLGADLARRAFISSVRAYATHAKSERDMFDVRELHLGHWAKAFGLRERPAEVGAFAGVGNGSHGPRRIGRGATSVGKRGGVGGGASSRGESGESREMEGSGGQGGVEEFERRRRMKRAMRAHMDAKSEFNIG